MKKASLHGLTFRNDVDIDGDVVTAPITDSYKKFANGAYSMIYNPFFRKIGGDPELRDDGAHAMSTRPSTIRYSSDGALCLTIGHQISRNGRTAKRSIRQS